VLNNYFTCNIKVQEIRSWKGFRPNKWFSIIYAKVILTLILQAKTTDTATCNSINCNFGITELLFH